MKQICYIDFQDLCYLQRAVEHEIRAMIVVRDNFKTRCKSSLLLDTNIEVYKRLQLALHTLIQDYETDNNKSL